MNTVIGAAPARAAGANEHFSVHKLRRPNIRGRDIAYDIRRVPTDARQAAGGGGQPSGIGLDAPYSAPPASPGIVPPDGGAGGETKTTTLTARRLKDRLAGGGVFKVRGLEFEQVDNPDGTQSIRIDARRVKYRRGGETFRARGFSDTFTVGADGKVIPGQADARRIRGRMGLDRFEQDLPGVIQTVLKDLKGAA